LAKIRKRKGLAFDAALIEPVPSTLTGEAEGASEGEGEGDGEGEGGRGGNNNRNDVDANPNRYADGNGGSGFASTAFDEEGGQQDIGGDGMEVGSVDQFLAYFKEQSKSAADN